MAITSLFNTIAIVGKPRHNAAFETHLSVYNWLRDHRYDVMLNKQVADICGIQEGYSLEQIGENQI